MKSRPRLLFRIFFSILFAFSVIFGYLYLTQVSLPDKKNPIKLIGNQTQDDLKLTYLKAIGSAKKSITLMIYALNDKKLIHALNKKSGEGVDILVICDKKASSGIHRRLRPNIAIHYPNARGLMHLKILVIDDAQVWTGSANLTGDSLRIHGNFAAGLYSPELAGYISSRAADMVDPSAPQAPKHKIFSINNQTVEMWFLPKNTKALNRLKDLIRNAEKSIRIAMYTWTRNDMAQTVARAYKRGVDVQVVIDATSAKGPSRKVVQFLKEAGVPVNISNGNGLLHHKMMYLDNRILVNGSANWTKAAFTQNDDCFMIFHDLTNDQQKKLDHLWKVIEHESNPVKDRPYWLR